MIPMNAAELSLDSEEWGDENDPNSDWSIAHNSAHFIHTDACEFMFYLGTDEYEESRSGQLEELRKAGHSEHFINYFWKAQKAGYNWLNLYTA